MTADAFGSGLRGVALRTLLERMMIDAPWCWGHSPGGFCWLGSSVIQKIKASEPFESRGLTVVRLTATTLVADRVRPSDALPVHLDALNRMEIGSRWIHDTETGQLLMTCSALVHPETLASRMSLLAGYALLQVSRAEALLSSGLTDMVGGSPAIRVHPDRGPRPAPDEMLGVLGQVFIPHGRAPSRYRSEEEFAEAEASLGSTPFYTAGSSAEGIAAEVAVGDDTILIQLFSNAPHPVIGTGLASTIRCRVADRGGSAGEGLAKALALATELNQAELEPEAPGLGIGAWHTHAPGGAVAEVAHTAFSPNASFGPGRVRDALWCAIDRAVWLSRRLAPDRDPLRGTLWDTFFRLLGEAEVEPGTMN